MSLLKKVRETTPRRRATDEEVKLALGYIMGEVRYSDVRHWLGASSSTVNLTLLRGIREAHDRGIIKINKRKFSIK